MVREKKSRTIDIDKLHELIDSASLPKGKTLNSYEEKKLETLRKRLSNDPLQTPEKIQSPRAIHSKPDSLQPQVLVHKPAETQKKDDRVIQINLTPRKTKKQPNPVLVDFKAATEDLFVEEPLYEIEKVDVKDSEYLAVQSEHSQKNSEPDEEGLSVQPLGLHEDEDLPEWIPVSRKTQEEEPAGGGNRGVAEEVLPEFDRVDERFIGIPISSYEHRPKKPLEGPITFEKVDVQPQQQEKVKNRKMEKEEQKRKKVEEKLTRQEAKRLAKEQKKKLKIETLEAKQKQHEEQKQKELEAKKIAAEAEEKRCEEQRLQKERGEKLRIEEQELQRREKEELRRRQDEEKHARFEAKGKEQEAKRLAKEHDKQRQIELAELQKKQNEQQKQKELEKRKAVLEAKEKEREEHQLMKEREEKLRLERRELQKKEKEEEAYGKSLAKKQAVPRVTKTSDAPMISLPTVEEQHRQDNPEEHMATSPWESLSEEIQDTKQGDSFTVQEEPPSHRMDKARIKEQKRQQKRLAREQKQKQLLEQRELKREAKEKKIQERLEEKQRAKLFKVTKENKEMVKQKERESKHAKEEAMEKELKIKKQQDEDLRRKEEMLEAKEIELKIKEKEEQRLKHIEYKKEKKRLSELGVGTAKDAGVIRERKAAEDQRRTMDLVQIASEEKERREAKTFERKLKKEQKKKEKEERKKKISEEMKAKKNMELHLEEESIKEKLSGRTEERSDPFIAFDSIDQQTAVLLSKYGYTSVEKLREATIKDLTKIGLKKKNAQMIIAESEEFSEWQVLDTDDQSMRI